MTATLERWWTPTGKIPVEQILRPGPDPHKDLGLALLAVHRAGAEACELVAQTAVADEYVLIEALAETRKLVAPAAVETIAKSVDGPQYAGLLLRDLLDDAENAALVLYRTCLSKSVAPPVAAQRVGMVYGCSSRALGRYASVASDPKATPVMVQDLADRTLFDFVAKVVEEEYVPAKELVSKASAYEQQHNVENGPDGRFVRERTEAEVLPGLTLAEMIRQAEERERRTANEPVKGPQVAKPKQMKRMKQIRRMQRPSEQTMAPQQMKPQQMRRQSMLAQKLTPQQMRLQELLEPPPLPLAFSPRPVPNLFTKEGGAPLPANDDAFSYILPTNEFLSVGRAAADGVDGSHILRVGGLDKYAGGAREYGRNGEVSEDHIAGVEHVLDLMHASEEFRHQKDLVTEDVDSSLFLGGDPKAMERQAKLAFLERVRAGKVAGALAEHTSINPQSEVTHVTAVANMADPNKVTMVWRPQGYGPNGTRLRTRAIPSVVEVVVKKGAARATKKANKVTVDPDAAIKMASLVNPNVPTDSDTQPTRIRVWDPRLKAIRTLVTAVQASEGEVESARTRAGKAEDYLDRHNVQNGPHGQFVRERTVEEVLPGLTLADLFAQAKERHGEQQSASQPQRMKQMRRMKRMARPRAPLAAAQTMQPQSMQAQSMQAQSMQRQRLAVQHAHAVGETDGLIPNDSARSYAPLSPSKMNELLEQEGYRGFVDGRPTILLSAAGRLKLAEGTIPKGSEPELAVMNHAIGSWNKLRNEQMKQSGAKTYREVEKVVVARRVVKDTSDLDIVATELAEAFAGSKDLSMLHVYMERDRNGQTSLAITGNIGELPQQHLVQMPEEGTPTHIRGGGNYRLQNESTLGYWLSLMYYRTEKFGAIDDTIANPHVKAWYAE